MAIYITTWSFTTHRCLLLCSLDRHKTVMSWAVVELHLSVELRGFSGPHFPGRGFFCVDAESRDQLSFSSQQPALSLERSPLRAQEHICCLALVSHRNCQSEFLSPLLFQGQGPKSPKGVTESRYVESCGGASGTFGSKSQNCRQWDMLLWPS